MNETEIDQTFADHQSISGYVNLQFEISFQASVDSVFAKNLLMAVASYFERQIQADIAAFTQDSTTNELVVSLVKRKAMDRQYHTYFKWKA